MEEEAVHCLIIGSDIKYTYGEQDRINIDSPFPTESIMYRAQLKEPGYFGKKNVVAVKKFRVATVGEIEQIANDIRALTARWRNMTKLKHENVVTYHMISFHSGSHFLELDFVMDYNDGTDLGTMMARMTKAKRSLHVKTLFDFCKQMANGLAYLHENNIIHGDLKPNSVLVNQSSMNRFRLRLCGLDSVSSSHVAFLQLRYCSSAYWMAPEMLTIIRDGASLILDDPVFSALHRLRKRLASGRAVGDDGFAAGDDDVLGFVVRHDLAGESQLMEMIISVYSAYNNMHRLVPGIKNFREGFLQWLQNITPNVPEPCVQLLAVVHNICSEDPVILQRMCAGLENDKNYSGVMCGDSAVTLDTVMSGFFQHILAQATAFPETGSLAGLESRVTSNPNECVRVDGRKADIWSLGGIINKLADLAFDSLLKLQPDFPAGAPLEELTLLENEVYLEAVQVGFRTMNENLLDFSGNEERLLYWIRIVPKDFKRIAKSCQLWSMDSRPTALELVNMLVALEEDTFGSTWVNGPHDGVTDADHSDSHRQMLEEIGCACEYHYNYAWDFLGQGAYGHVYKAKIINSGTYKGNDTVAVKEVTLNNFRVKHLKQCGSWDRAKEQWQNLVELRHPHLVTYHKVTLWKLTQGAAIEFMMDYCQGGDLDALITQCKTGICSLSPDAVANYATQLALGLCFLHENQFIHGDLKPGNVLLERTTSGTDNRTLRIGDLDGAVRIRDDPTVPERKDLAGTGPYMSPEMVMQTLQQEPEDIGLPTDIWSLGCVILDLANCSVGIKERIFYKTVTSAEGILETQTIERQRFSADAFLFKLSQGYRPFVSEAIRQDIKETIHCCLVPACRDRATAALALEQLLCDANGDPR